MLLRQKFSKKTRIFFAGLSRTKLIIPFFLLVKLGQKGNDDDDDIISLFNLDQREKYFQQKKKQRTQHTQHTHQHQNY